VVEAREFESSRLHSYHLHLAFSCELQNRLQKLAYSALTKMATDDVLPPPVQDALPLSEAMVAAPSTSARPDAHTQRYDRQLR